MSRKPMLLSATLLAMLVSSVAWADSNTVNLYQNDYSNQAYLTQNGANNLIGTTQSNLSNSIQGTQTGYSLNVQNTQDGQYNTFGFSQQNTGSQIFNEQHGYAGTVSATQLGGDYNLLQSNQTGSAYYAKLTTYQEGGANRIYSTQSQGTNEASVTQVGNSHVVSGYQFNYSGGGNANGAAVYQSGTGNNASYSQIGANNVASITQH